MKRQLVTLLGVAGGLALLVAQVAGQDTLPPVYDATGAMLTAVAPPPQQPVLPTVYDATAAMQASLVRETTVEGRQDASTQGIAGYINAHGALQAALVREITVEARQDASTHGIAGYINAHEAVTTTGSLPLVYDARGAMEVAVVPPTHAAATSEEATSAMAVQRADPSIYLMIGLGLLGAAAVAGGWALTHRPSARRHGPRHV